MAKTSSHEVTQLLIDWSRGNRSALDKLIPLIDGELRRLAHRYMRRENPGHTQRTTALVQEAYLRLVDQKRVHWKNRAYFLALTAQLMRRILLDRARSHRYAKRGGGTRKISFNETKVFSRERGSDLIALDEALERLATIDPRKGKVVELRFFGGLSVDETTDALQISPVTIMREWTGQGLAL